MRRIAAIGAIGLMALAGCGGGGGGGGGSVPEPSTLSIFGAALLAALGYRFARSRAPQLLPVSA